MVNKCCLTACVLLSLLKSLNSKKMLRSQSSALGLYIKTRWRNKVYHDLSIFKTAAEGFVTSFKDDR